MADLVLIGCPMVAYPTFSAFRGTNPAASVCAARDKGTQ